MRPSVCSPLPFSPKGFPALARSPQLQVIVARSHLWTLCPEVGSLRTSPAGCSFSDGHSVFKVLSIDELP